MSDIFISYANADRERAKQLADMLANRGYGVWWDRTIPPGRMFDEVIQEAIQGARCMIVLWSTASVRSNWVKTEASEGAARNILVPALLGEVAPPIEFKRIQSANLTEWSGDEAHAEYRNLLDSVERLMKQTPSVTGQAASVVQDYKPIQNSMSSRVSALKTFGMGAMFALLMVGALGLYSKFGQGHALPPPLMSTPTATTAAATITEAPPVSTPVAAAANTGVPRGRVNLLSAEQGGQLLIASTDQWKLLIDGKEDNYVWTDNGFGIFGFRDNKTALLNTFTLLIPKQADNNIKDFELFVGNGSPTGPFESIGRFSTQNMRIMQNPYQEFHFAPVKAKFFKFQPLRGHDDSTTTFAYEIQLFGELQ